MMHPWIPMITYTEREGAGGDGRWREGNKLPGVDAVGKGDRGAVGGEEWLGDKEGKILDKEGDESGERDSAVGWQKNFETWTLDPKNTITLAHKQARAQGPPMPMPPTKRRSACMTWQCGHTPEHRAPMPPTNRRCVHSRTPKNLHLGHLAACFGLRKAPTLRLGNTKKVDTMIVGKKRMSERDKVDAKRAKMIAARRKHEEEGKDQQACIQ